MKLIILENWMIALIIIAVVLVLAFIVFLGLCFTKYERYPVSEVYKKYCFYIPARNEASVIARIIKSIQALDYPQDKITIYVLANNCHPDDDTAKIARSLGVEVFELQDSNVNRVGQVLERFFTFIKEKYGGYDAFDGYLRLDADNTLDPNYLKRLNDAFIKHPTVVVSYRACTTFNGARTSLSSILVAAAMMAFRLFSSLRFNPMITGPGILISSEVITKMDGWHLTTLSEDMELSVFLVKAKIRSHFAHEAIFYDEQVGTFKLLFRQRLRWTKGTNQCFHKYWFLMIKRIFSKMGFSALFLAIGLFPMGFIAILSTLGFGIYATVMTVISGTYDPLISFMIITLILNIVPGWLVASLTFFVERKRIKDVKWYQKIYYILIFPVSLFLYSLADFVGHFIKVKWKAIPHGEKIKS
ncbi:MAG: glycosyltransferase family 2 protein [Erysipelotrichaceae bacterium]|jgi:cellulose synthase/poly-beta-1,6-N-acetylglucosamine synthase-like glycosyltransferase|nr:glycosyltransferase family 2 protein [Erysipelotrichaceae bacterium]